MTSAIFWGDYRAVWVEEATTEERISEIIFSKSSHKYEIEMAQFEQWLEDRKSTSELKIIKNQKFNSNNARIKSLMDNAHSCNDSHVPSEDYAALGQIYYQAENYQLALNCFMMATENEIDLLQVYQKIGLMYELGQGVEASMDEAKKWYRKAGLLNYF